MKKRILSVVLALILLVGIIPMTMLSVSADVDEGGSNPLQMPTPQNVKASFVGFVDPTGKNAVVVEISWDALSDVDGGNKFVEMWPTLKEDANLSLPMSFEAWMGQATLIPVDELQQGGIGYVTKDGRSILRSVVHILQPGELKVDESGMACGVKENDVIDIDIYTAGYDPATQTSGESDHKHIEIVYTEENVKNKKTFTEELPAECTHENQETKAEVLNVKGNVTIDGKTTGVALLKDTEECTDCHQKKTTKVYRLRFSSRKQMLKYLYGKYAKLSNGKKVHFKGKYEKVEKVYWNKKHIKVSKAYSKKKGSVILEFTDDFLNTVEDGTHELMVCNGDEFTAMTVTVQDHEMVEIGAYDMDAEVSITADEYDAVMQECEDNGIEVVDCDLDEFYASGFMTNADDVEVTMSLSADSVVCTGKAITPPSVTLKSETDTEYAEDVDYTLSYYQVTDGADGEPNEVEVAPEAIAEAGTYAVVATPTRSGVLFGEARAQFTVSTDIKLGDANGDNAVNILDATAIQRQLADIPNDYFSEDAADTDRNGSVAIVDATYIQRWLADIDAPAGIGEPIAEEDPFDVLDSGSLVGTWAYEEDPDFVYTFNANGTGTYTIHGEVLNLTYQDNGTSVDYEMGGVPGSFEYTISGNTLIIKDSAGEDVKYTRQ